MGIDLAINVQSWRPRLLQTSSFFMLYIHSILLHTFLLSDQRSIGIFNFHTDTLVCIQFITSTFLMLPISFTEPYNEEMLSHLTFQKSPRMAEIFGKINWKSFCYILYTFNWVRVSQRPDKLYWKNMCTLSQI